MANYDTGKDIIEDMLSRAGELRLNAAELSEEAKRYANRGYFNVIRQFQWLWAEAYPPFTFVTFWTSHVLVNIEAGSTTFVTDTTALANYGSQGKLVLESDGIPMRFTTGATTSPNVGTLPFVWPHATVTNASAWIYTDEYLLSNCLSVSRIKNMSKPRSMIEIVGYEEMDETMPISYPFGTISKASFYHEDWFRLAMIPQVPELLEVYYTKRPPPLDFSGNYLTDTPILPHDERWIIADYGLYFLMVDRGDDRAQGVAQIAAGRVAEIKDRQISKMSPRIYLPDAFNMNFR